jgi:hypothetical protein
MKGNLRTAGTFGVLLLLSMPVQAMAGQTESFDQLSKVVRTGDLVEVTDWTRTRVKGHVAELTGSAIAVVKDGRQIKVDADAVKEIRLLRRRDSAPMRTADAGSRCGNAPCMAMSMALAGTTSLARGVGRLFERPKVVYRARDRGVLS